MKEVLNHFSKLFNYLSITVYFLANRKPEKFLESVKIEWSYRDMPHALSYTGRDGMGGRSYVSARCDLGCVS